MHGIYAYDDLLLRGVRRSEYIRTFKRLGPDLYPNMLKRVSQSASDAQAYLEKAKLSLGKDASFLRKTEECQNISFDQYNPHDLTLCRRVTFRTPKPRNKFWAPR